MTETYHLKHGPSGHLRYSVNGHLVNQCGWQEFVFFSAPLYPLGAGDSGVSTNNPPLQADYNAAWADLPDGADASGNFSGPGYRWPLTHDIDLDHWYHVVEAIGICDAVVTEIMATVTAAKFRITLTPSAGNWSGEITFKIRYGAGAGPANPTEIASWLNWGTALGEMKVDAAQVSQDFVIDPDEVDCDPGGVMNLVVYPDCVDDPGFPGGGQLYEKVVGVSARLLLRGAVD